MSIFPMQLKKLIEESNKTQNAICKDLGISKQKLSKWKTAYNEPSIDELMQLATYFEVSSDYLIGLENYDGTKKTVRLSDSFNNNSGSINFKA